ncbi:spinster family MFS transporter [Sphingobium vermicomposti]|uniref:Putative MFS family arabinose efflux permease n=1 Tax=Sphingobium vermicomposti TaxID=529005 RepID=A0A846M6K9_9SPHN|nr:MFS transporter [Sphingobium vermicomposti]NIJ17917.1 putative MFS family arabinose efflux permease [Sphingobium vermicomposti]
MTNPAPLTASDAFPTTGTDAIAGAAPVKGRRRTAILLMLAFIYSLNFLDRQIIVILQEPIKADFGLADWELGLLTGGAFGLFYTSMGIPIAHLIDRGVNRVRLIALFTASWSILTALCGLTRGFGGFFAARMGVGLAEAGFAPAAHSMISDLYSPRERPAAVGVFAIGVPVGVMVGLAIGGIVAEATDWRTALLFAGIPGVLIAILFPLVAREPVRGGTEDTPHQVEEKQQSLSFLQTLRILGQRRAFIHIIAGTAIMAFAQTGISTWLPSFLIRSHDMSMAHVGISLGLISGIGGAIGTWYGGWQGTRRSKSGLHMALWLPIAGMLICVPLDIIALSMSDGQSVLLVMIPSYIFGSLWTAPSIALIQSLAPVPMRARASALNIVAANLIGVSMGPLVAGILSDWFAYLRGGDAALGLRDAMMCLTAFFVWAAWHWTLAARLLQRESLAAA